MISLDDVLDGVRSIAKDFWNNVAQPVIDFIQGVFGAFKDFLKWLANLVYYFLSGQWLRDLLAWLFGGVVYRIVLSHDGPGVDSRAQIKEDGMSVAPVKLAWSFTDSGPRRFFTIDPQGIIKVVGPDFLPVQKLIPLDASDPEAISYQLKRKGETKAAPAFDMVAADGGRVFAKEEGFARFYFTMLEPMFLKNPNTPVSSVYFKLDPEQGILSADNADRRRHLEQDAPDHPASVRFPLFRLAMGFPLMDSMAVNVDFNRRRWHEIDARPPSGSKDPPSGSRFPPIDVAVTYERGFRIFGYELRDTITQKSYLLKGVLSIGVGHEHWHEHESTIYSGEIDSLDGPGLRDVLVERNAYRYFNGPVDDKGGFIDGTVNYYVLGRFLDVGDFERDDPPPNAFGILWLDEQAALSERWRLLHPDDSGFSGFEDVIPSAAVQYLERDASYPKIDFDRTKFWCPFLDRHIYDQSSMVVSRQMVAVTGWDPDDGKLKIYTIHFGFGTCDRTWAWRLMPEISKPPETYNGNTPTAGLPHIMAFAVVVVDNGNGPPRPGGGVVVTPPTTSTPRPNMKGYFGLREDMTLWVGADFPNGRWYWFQKILPADQGLRPDGTPLRLSQSPFSWLITTFIVPIFRLLHLNGPKPTISYTHPWQFHRKDIFEAIHANFSHFGVYEKSVDCRSQYYEVSVNFEKPTERGDEAACWADLNNDLAIDQRVLDWKKVNALVGSIENGDAAAVAGAILNTLGAAAVETFQDLIENGPSFERLLDFLRHLVESDFSNQLTRRSLFNNAFCFSLRYRAGVGWIMVHADKRDDDLLCCSFHPWGPNPAADLLLTHVKSPGETDDRIGGTATIKIIKHRRILSPPRIVSAKVIVHLAGVPSRPKMVRIEFLWSPGTAPKANNSIEENVWRIRMGALTRTNGAIGGPILLFDRVREGAFNPDQSIPNQYSYEWPLAGEPGILVENISQYVNEIGRVTYGTSLWFIDITGHVAIPESIRFDVVVDE